MTTINNIDNTIFEINNIVKRRKSPVGAILWLIAGIAILVAKYNVEAISSSANLSSAAILMGSLVLIVGITKLVMVYASKSGVVPVYKPTGEKLERYEMFFDASLRDKISGLVDAGDFDKLLALPRSDSAAVLVVIYKTAGGDVLLAQVLEFVPHYHQPVTETLYFAKESYKLSSVL